MNNINNTSIKNIKNFENGLKINDHFHDNTQNLYKNLDNFENNIKKKAINLFNKGMFSELNSFIELHIRNYPTNLVLLNFLGVSQYKIGKIDLAFQTFNNILEIAPKNADALNSIGIILNDKKKWDKAIIFLNKAAKIQSKNSSVFNNLGLSYAGKKQYKLSIKFFLKAIKIDNNHDALRNMINVECLHFMQLKDYKSAEKILLKIKEDNQKQKKDYNFDVLSNLLNCFFNLGKIKEAEKLCDEVINNKLESFDFFYNAAYFYGLYKNDGKKALEYSRKALELSPENFDALLNLSYYYYALLKDHSAALKVLKKLILLYPNDTRPLINLGSVFEKNGFHKNALLTYVKALKLDPNDITVYNSLLFTISLMPNLSDEEVFEEFLKFGKLYNNPKRMFKYHKSSKIVDKKIKIGFVSADFREHAIKQVLLPVYQNINKEKFELYSYSNDVYEDYATIQYKSYSQSWINCNSMNDFELAQKIWNDKIDILFDMSGHTNGNRLISFTYKPAPIQITWMGWPLTTGLSAIDYTIYDNYFAPKTADAFFVEKILRLPNHFQFLPPKNLSVNKPSGKRQFKEIVFASFNHSRKLNEEVIECWCKILKKVKNSKIIIGNLEQLSLDWLGNTLIDNGIKKSRIELLSPMRLEEYLKLHPKIDLLLDSWPYSGGTTTAYAAMYGVPVITLSGKNVAQNQSSGIMKNIGITEGIVTSKDDYISKAVELASDVNQLHKIKLKNFKKYKHFTEKKQRNSYGYLENLLTQLWNDYCIKKN